MFLLLTMSYTILPTDSSKIIVGLQCFLIPYHCSADPQQLKLQNCSDKKKTVSVYFNP